MPRFTSDWSEGETGLVPPIKSGSEEISVPLRPTPGGFKLKDGPCLRHLPETVVFLVDLSPFGWEFLNLRIKSLF